MNRHLSRGLWFTLLATSLLTSGCTRYVTLPGESIREVSVDTVYRTRMLTDSIVSRDSVKIEMTGDTLVRTIVRERLRYRDRTDTVYRTQRDTMERRIPIPVEHAPSLRERIRISLPAAVGGVAAGILAAAAFLIWRRRE